MNVMNIHESVFYNFLVSNRGEFVIAINGKWQRHNLHEVIGTRLVL
jgi:hypothetical protein